MLLRIDYASALWGHTGLLALGIFIVVLVAIFLKVKPRIGAEEKELKPTPPYLFQFPPSRRHVLGKGATEIPPHMLHARALPTTRAQDFDQDDLYTPTGFSTQEIRALGRFPDYSKLSGIRAPEPYGPAFDITKATFRPFRPFRWNYHQTMSLMKFDPDWWVELEKNYHATMAARQDLLAKYPSHILFTNPGSELACRELMEMLLQFITTRHPCYFSLENQNTVLVNRLLQTQTNLLTTPPLRVIFDNIPEDYALMLRNEIDGTYYLRAAMACSSVGWDIGQHRNKPLSAIHAHVPDFKSKLEFSMDRFFAKMPVDQPIQRCSWGLEDHAPLFSSPAVVEGWQRSAFADDPDQLTADDLQLRCDWQTLRRLPVSGAVVFNFKAVFTPFSQLREEPFVPALLLRILQEGKENLISYKCVEHVKRVAMEALEGWAREQVEAGVVPVDWEVATLDESPFYPGWEERWRAGQRF